MSDKPVAEKLLDGLDKLDKAVDGLKKGKTNGLAGLRGAPAAVRPDSLGSKGYSFTKALRYCAKHIGSDDCPVELEYHNRLHTAYASMGYTKAQPNSFMMPVGADLIYSNLQDVSLAEEIRQVTKAGIGAFDREEAVAYRQKMSGQVSKTSLSWIDETLGGTLVAPPMQGELIEILRNKEVFMQAGARVIGMPPQGRVVYPRQTGVATAYWVGESAAITDSAQGTGDLVLSAKKLGVLCKIPNELFRFASVSIEQFVRDDIARVAALTLDQALLDNVGSQSTPKGIINYSNIQTVIAKTTGATGDTFSPEDPNSMIAAVEGQNAEPNFFAMRPSLWYALVNRRADSITTADGKGPFVFNLWRSVADGFQNEGGLAGLKVIRSNQIVNSRVKSSGTTLTYVLCGDGRDYLLAMGGVIEFLIGQQGDTAMANDQTWVRGIQYVDGGPRHEASFAFMDTLVNS